MSERGTSPAQSDRSRRRLGPGLTAFLVIDVLLVLALVVVAVVAFSDRTPQDEDPPVATGEVEEPESSPEPSVPEDPEDAESVEAFRLPSGNIFCEMTDTSATCSIIDFSFDPVAPPAGCEGTAGNVLTIVAGGELMFPCVEGEVTLPDDLPVLGYGEASHVGEMTCQSSTNGATCLHSDTGRGFSVARAGYTDF